MHVWCLELASTGLMPQEQIQLLDAGELERLGRYRFEADRRKFAFRRGILRRLLGNYLQVDPRDIRYAVNEFGKPRLDKKFHSNLHFNLSASGEISLFAFIENRPVGIDVEQLRGDFDTGPIAGRFFSDSERQELHELPADQKLPGFYNCWTRKEAVIKALGRGLSLPLASFDVNLKPGAPARVVGARENARDAQRVTLQELTPAAGYIAALATLEGGWRLESWRYVY